MEKELKALRIDRDRKTSVAPRTWLLVLVAFLVGALAAGLLFRVFLETDPPSAEVVNAAAAMGDASTDPVSAQVKGEDSDAPILIVSGYIVPHHRIEVGSKIVGKVTWIGVEKSDKVEKDQVLVKLDDSEFQAQLEQSRAALNSAQAQLAELEAGSRPEEIQGARAELQRSRADLENADLEFERLKSLLDHSGVVSKQQVDNARSRRDMARATVAVAEKNLRIFEIGPRVEQIELARAEVKRNRAAVRYWQTQIDLTEIRAPSAGTILERISEVGEMVSTSFAGGATVVALADLNDLQVELDISQSDFHNIAIKNRCKMSPLAYAEREYRCEIAEIAPEANRQRATIQVKVQILEPDEYLRPEMDAQVTFYRPEQ